jgi:hydroxyacylglutathione hydrolase
MKVQTLVVGSFSVNCHIVSCDDARAMIIDPGDDAMAIADLIRKQNLHVTAYLITHGHMDHVSALAELTDLFPAPVGIHPADEKWAFIPSNAMPPYYNTPRRPKTEYRALIDDQRWNQLDMECRVITTPGHSPGCVCFYFPDAGMIFTGDTLFAGSVGRTDLPGGDEALLSQSLKRLVNLPDDTVVFPGHGPKSTIAREKKSNPFLGSIT